MSKYHRSNKNKKKLIGVGAALIAVAGVVALLEMTGITNMFGSPKSTPKNESPIQTTSSVPSAQADYGDGEPREPGNTLREDRGSAVVTDNGGAPSSNTSTSVKSATGEITVYLPVKDSPVNSGQEISGDSTLSSVDYRVIDSNTGVIATGQLQVVNGRFSGTLSFSTSASEGRIDIFATKSDGTEFSNIEIPVRFNQ